ncbi:MAG: DUF4249 family protein [Bacteroidia bacterium]
MRWIYIAILFSLVSCEMDIPMEDITFSKKLVINSISTSDSSFDINVSTSAGTLSEPSAMFNDRIDLQLIRNEDLVYSNSVNVIDGKVKLPLICFPNSKYEIQIAIDGYPTVRAVDSVPSSSPNFSLVELEKNNSGYELIMNVEDGQMSEHFLLEVFSIGKEFNGTDSVYAKHPLTFSSNDKLFISNIRTVSQQNNFALFSDNVLQSDTTEFRLFLEKDSLSTETFSAEEVVISLSTISNTMFAFYVDILKNTQVYSGPLSYLTFESGNVEQGLGVFAFRNTSTKVIKLPD